MIAPGKMALASSVCLLAGAVAVHAAQAQDAATSSSVAASAPDVAMETFVEQACSGCHAIERVRSQSRSANQWAATLEDMNAMGARLSAAESKRVVAYLAKHYGPGAASEATTR